MALTVDLEAVVAGAVGGHRAPGAQVALSVGGETSCSRTGYGIADDTRFEIGSVTKVSVATAVVEHVVAGRLRLDDRPGHTAVHPHPPSGSMTAGGIDHCGPPGTHSPHTTPGTRA